MSLPIEVVVGSGIIIMFAYAVFGLTGFGSSITAVPLLAHLVPLRIAVPMMLLFDLLAGSRIAVKNRSSVDFKELVHLAPFLLAGMVFGVTFLVNVPERWLLLILGLFVLTYSAWTLLFRKSQESIAPFWCVPFGAVGGMFTAMFGTGGPIYAIYLARRITDARTLRSSISTLIVFTAIVRLGLFAIAGLYAQSELLLLSALMLPCAMLGFVVGTRYHNRLPAERVVQIVWCILIFGGISLVNRGFS